MASVAKNNSREAFIIHPSSFPLSHITPPSTLPTGSIVDAYIRDSGGPRQDASTDRQITELETYCKQHGLILRNKFVDVAKSGGSTTNRDQFNNLIDSTRRPADRPKGILLWNYARFARDLDDAIYYKALLRSRSIIVHSLTDPIPEGQYGRIIEFFIDISNEEKKRQTSSDARSGLRDLVLKHKCVPGTPPRGFKREPVHIGTHRDGSAHTAHRWIPDPEMTPLIKRAWQLRADRISLGQIHEQTHLFNAISSYKTFFINPIYIGILEFGDLTITDYCEPMIDMDTWNAVQKIIADYARAKTAERHPRRADSPYLLSGLVYCENCGAPLFGNTVTRTRTDGSRDEAYRCTRARNRRDCKASRIPRRKLEEAVLNTLREYILLPDSLAAIMEVELHSSNHLETKRQARLDILSADKKKLSSQIANITRAIAERGHSATLLDKLNELERQRDIVLTEFTTLSNTHYHAAPPLTPEESMLLSQTLTERLLENDEGSVARTRQILQSFVHKIIAKKQDGKITGSITYFSPSPTLQEASPPFELAPTDQGGYTLPISRPSVGALS